MDRARNPRDRFGNEAIEQSARSGADVVAAFGMPLNAEDKVRGGTFGGLAAFDCFDDGILRAAGGDAETVAGNADSLMVTRIDWEPKEVVLFGSLLWNDQRTEKRFRRRGRGVSDGNLAAGGVINREDVEILQQGAAAPDIENLNAEADGEDRFVEIVRVLQQKFIDVFARVVRRSALGDRVLAVLMGIDVGRAAWK